MRKLAILTLVLAACSGSGSEGPLLTFADFESPPASVLSEPSTSTTLIPSTTTTLPPPTTTTTLLVVDVPAAVTVRNAEGFLVLEEGGAPFRVTTESLGSGFDDLQGGFVFQLPGAGERAAADQRVFWSRAGSPDAQPFLDINEGSLLKLWGVEDVDGRPVMILTIVDNPTDDVARTERLAVFDFETGDRVLAEVGTSESTPVSVSYAGGRFLLEIQDGPVTRFEFLGPAGEKLDLATNPNNGCETMCPRHPTLDPTGSQVAHVTDTPGPDGGTWLEVLDIDLGEERARIGLPGGPEAVTSLQFDGETVIVNRRLGNGEQQALIVDIGTESVGEFGMRGDVRFLRVAPAFQDRISVLG